MAQRFDSLNEKHTDFIERQKMYFIATAPTQGFINLSPKGLDSLRIVDHETIRWLNLTGSGNESAAHVLENNRMTLMFCAFEGPPLILRVYGQTKVIHPRDEAWATMIEPFQASIGARQIFELKIDLVQTSCGFGVPLYEVQGDREALIRWADNKTPEDIDRYWREKNRVSLDGLPTGIVPSD